MRIIFSIVVISILICSCGGNYQDQALEQEQESSTIKEFSDLGNEEGFAEDHDEPKEAQLEPQGELVALDVEGGAKTMLYSRKKEGSENYLLVFHEWWGLNDHIKLEADRLYDELGNVNVLALDLYNGNVATTREKAKELMQTATEEHIHEIIDATLASLPAEAKIGAIGWCFGGGWSLRAALRAKEKTVANVIYYGMPLEGVDELKELNSDVLYIIGKQDEWISRNIVVTFYDKMQAAGKTIEVLTFDADHAFANPSSERYLEQAAQEANAAALTYLKERLQ